MTSAVRPESGLASMVLRSRFDPGAGGVGIEREGRDPQVRIERPKHLVDEVPAEAAEVSTSTGTRAVLTTSALPS